MRAEAIGHRPALQDGFFVVVVLTSVASSITFLPGGIGGYEALSIAPLEAAAPATLLMRGFSFWLPMLPGVWFARRELAARAVQ